MSKDSQKKEISLVIFDMDGLMFDTEPIAIDAWIKAGKSFGIEIPRPVIMECIGLNNSGTEKVMKKHFGEEFPYVEAKKLCVELIMQHIEENGIPVKKGLYELMDLLKQKGISKALATSTERSRAERYLTLANLRNDFELIVGGDQVAKGKPEPDIFLAAAKGLGCEPGRCIVLEDSENGIKAASRAGMLPVLVPDLKRPPEEVAVLAWKEFKSLLDVRDFLYNYLKK